MCTHLRRRAVEDGIGACGYEYADAARARARPPAVAAEAPSGRKRTYREQLYAIVASMRAVWHVGCSRAWHSRPRVSWEWPSVNARSRVHRTHWRVVMVNLMLRLRALVHDVTGQDLIEYALLAGLIALGSVLLLQSAGTEVSSIWTDIVAALQVASS